MRLLALSVLFLPLLCAAQDENVSPAMAPIAAQTKLYSVFTRLPSECFKMVHQPDASGIGVTAKGRKKILTDTAFYNYRSPQAGVMDFDTVNNFLRIRYGLGDGSVAQSMVLSIFSAPGKKPLVMVSLQSNDNCISQQEYRKFYWLSGRKLKVVAEAAIFPAPRPEWFMDTSALQPAGLRAGAVPDYALEAREDGQSVDIAWRANRNDCDSIPDPWDKILPGDIYSERTHLVWKGDRFGWPQFSAEDKMVDMVPILLALPDSVLSILTRTRKHECPADPERHEAWWYELLYASSPDEAPWLSIAMDSTNFIGLDTYTDPENISMRVAEWKISPEQKLVALSAIYNDMCVSESRAILFWTWDGKALHPLPLQQILPKIVASDYISKKFLQSKKIPRDTIIPFTLQVLDDRGYVLLSPAFDYLGNCSESFEADRWAGLGEKDLLRKEQFYHFENGKLVPVKDYPVR